MSISAGKTWCPICNEVMERGIDFVEGLLTLTCWKCNSVAGIYKTQVSLAIYALGRSFSVDDVTDLLRVFLLHSSETVAV